MVYHLKASWLLLTILISTALGNPAPSSSRLPLLSALPASNFSFPSNFSVPNADPVCIDDLGWFHGSLSASGYDVPCAGAINILAEREPEDHVVRDFVAADEMLTAGLSYAKTPRRYTYSGTLLGLKPCVGERSALFNVW
ncbi:hypothetical protein N7G274_006665 [Stereocaulon virgatum]|uniref:Uncharacterized protein n=1 Tax=Stereocaulon virgatum TaxID=373712 RepID=A0ABR4A710_9LECA